MMISDRWFERTLVIAPHCDDETIGCGGLIAKLLSHGRRVHVNVVTGDDERFEEFMSAIGVLGGPEVSRFTGMLGDDDDAVDTDLENNLDQVPDRTLVSTLDMLFDEVRPTAVLLPYASHHQDHQKVHKAAIAALRPHPSSGVLFAAMYEYPYVDAWHHHSIRGSKLNFDITPWIDDKLDALVCHRSQMPHDPTALIHPDNVRRWAAVRGAEIGVPYAECYYPLRMAVPL